MSQRRATKSEKTGAPLFDVMEAIDSPETRNTGLPEYPKYRDSGVTWLGKVPEHWELSRAKWSVLACRNGVWGAEPDGENDVICARVADFDRSWLRVNIARPTLRAVTAKERKNRELETDDLLLEKSGGGELQPVGAVVVWDHKLTAVSSNFIARMPVRQGFDTWYLAFIHSHYYDRRVNTRSIKQSIGIQNLDSRQYLDEKIPVPPLPEQRAIAGFLRERTGKIDTLIAKKRAMIELLKEKRTALITHAVTKGLNPDAPTKPSGIDWLGDVPKHWEVPPLYARYESVLGKMLDQKQITKFDLVPYLRNVDVQWDSIQTDELPVMTIEEDRLDRFTVKHGDLLVCEGGEVGRAAIWNGSIEPCGFQKALHRLRPRDTSRENPRFLYYVFYAAAKMEVFIAGGNPNTIPHLTGEKLHVHRFPIPPKSEQNAIAKNLDEKSLSIFSLIDQVKSVISRLNEYRAALITDAVTGRIDVREYETTIPGE
ncbi:MAG: restriction endonuclease subunit S [Planctomycetota bacterium]